MAPRPGRTCRVPGRGRPGGAAAPRLFPRAVSQAVDFPSEVGVKVSHHLDVPWLPDQVGLVASQDVDGPAEVVLSDVVEQVSLPRCSSAEVEEALDIVILRATLGSVVKLRRGEVVLGEKLGEGGCGSLRFSRCTGPLLEALDPLKLVHNGRPITP